MFQKDTYSKLIVRKWVLEYIMMSMTEVPQVRGVSRCADSQFGNLYDSIG
jgi:hypothetical protein